MARAREIHPRTRTPMDELRDNLTELERRLPAIRGSGQRAVDMLYLLDDVYEGMAYLREQGADLRPEQGRWESLEKRLRSDRASVLVREVGKAVGWKALRAGVDPARERWWWYLDGELTRQWRARLTRWTIRALIVLVALALAFIAYRRFLALSPQAQEKLSLTQNAERYSQQGDLGQAIVEYEKAAALDPQDPETRMWLAVLYEQVGREEKALEAFQTVQRSGMPMSDYLLLRARTYLQLGILDGAAKDVVAAISIDPHSYQALFLLSDILERQGNYREAMDLFQKVSIDAPDPALRVVARVRYGMLLQAGPIAASTATPMAQAP